MSIVRSKCGMKGTYSSSTNALAPASSAVSIKLALDALNNMTTSTPPVHMKISSRAMGIFLERCMSPLKLIYRAWEHTFCKLRLRRSE